MWEMTFWVCLACMCCECYVKGSIDVLTRAKAKDPDALYFFQDKFRLVQMIATLQTPYVAVLDGYACKYFCGIVIRGYQVLIY